MNKVTYLEFDCSKWDEDGSNFVGLTGIMFDSCIVDENNKVIVLGEHEITIYLNKELAQACGDSVEDVEKDIYKLGA